MAELFGSSTEKNPFEELAVVYVLYFDEAQGHMPLLIYPVEKYKNDKTFMRPIKYHPIWFLSLNESDALDHIDLEFKGYTFFGKKFLTKSNREKRRSGLKVETPETIVIVVSLPNKIELFGDELIRILTQEVKDKYKDKLFEIIDSEILKEELIKSPKSKERIENGQAIKKQLRASIEKTTRTFFSDVIKNSDATSIRMQKAIAYLAFKGIDVSHINTKEYKGSFSNIQLFDPNKSGEVNFADKKPFILLKINIIDDSQEMEILVQNNSLEEVKGIIVKINHLKEYFEKEIMIETIDKWFPQEELVFISPIIPHIDEYIFFIIDEVSNEKLLSKRIDLSLLKTT
ncbi:MAG: hypothetical protein KGD68_11020 [Candidatus Lokiarchaeota archaeon]|nr:hypothetical protein [Candidatus Lokiarchaeota archaeon]